MLELKHLTKIYHSKDGGDVRALDDVNLSFSDTGLVFLTGRSGSGKSTLLNLMGGLDEATSGEFVVMGRSSSNFSPADFDSYRNTFVGFVFQEYNVLSEFNVEENVSLALELQGDTGGREKVQQILEEVELSEFGKRKPNTLSGGQKQRVAIARALVKDPQIIMADEPTGALDSATGRQVLKTLKKLSKTRLVLVVSHDREFAETYGDRIIELQDGKVVSDVTKRREQPEVLSPAVLKLGEGTLLLRGGESDGEALETVKAFLRDGKGELLLSKDPEAIGDFKRANRIDQEGVREAFVPTEPAAESEGGKPVRFIRSRLPFSKIFKIGFSGLRLKPVRLFLTILLSVVSFIMFGLFSTMMLYDENRVLENSFAKSEYSHLTFTKSYNTRVTGAPLGNYDYETRANFSPEEIFALGGSEAFGAYSVSEMFPANAEIASEYQDFYFPRINRIACVPADNPLRKDLVAGQYPEREDQLAVSEYFLECMKNASFTQLDANGEKRGAKKINGAEDLIGERVLFGGQVFELTGVFRGGLSEKYDLLKDGSSDNWVLATMHQMALREGVPTLALVSESFLETYGSLLRHEEPLPEESYFFDYTDEPFRIFFDTNANGYSFTELKRFKESYSSSFPILFFDEEKTTPEGDELIVPYYLLESYYSEHLSAQADIISYAIFESALYTFAGRTVKVAETADGISIYREATEEEWQMSKQIVLSFVRTYPLPLWKYSDRSGSVYDCRAIGIYGTTTGVSANGVFCSDSFYRKMSPHSAPVTRTKYVPSGTETFDTAFLPIGSDTEALHALLDMQGKRSEETDVTYTLQNVLYSNVLLVNEIIGLLRQVFLFSGLALVLFAALLLFNFISVSISGKKREIGILRAVGARGTDVFKIFFTEAGIIVGICAALAVAGSFALVAVLNFVLRARAGLDVTLFVLGPLSLLLMFGVALFVAFFATFLPVFFASRKKPVENIRSL